MEASSSAVEGFVDRFKGRKREEDPLYRQTVKEFERDLAESPLSFAGRSPAERNREAELRWDASQGRVLKKKVRLMKLRCRASTWSVCRWRYVR